MTDGEQSKARLLRLRERAADRLRAAAPAQRAGSFAAEVAAFPEYYEQYFGRAMTGGGAVARAVPLTASGRSAIAGQEALQRDIANLKAAHRGASAAEVFMPGDRAARRRPATSYYATEEEYLVAVADALHEEYQAIVDAGFLLQVDDPFLTELFSYPALDAAEQRRHGRDVRRGDQPRAARHPRRPRPLPHLLRHQRGPARARRRR